LLACQKTALIWSLPLDLVFADPPYNLGKKYGEGFKDKQKEGEYFAWCMKWFMAAYRALKVGGALYVMHYPEVAAHWKQQLDNILAFRRWITWVYPSNTGHSDNNWRRSHRTILYYVKGEEAIFFDGEADPQPYRNPDDARVKHLGKEGTTPYDWWGFDLVKNVSKEKKGWPNQLPLRLLKRIILSSCAENGVVCDPFVGSGTTAEAAVTTNRMWLGFDIQAKACGMTNKRAQGLISEPSS
jgi:DNA modification methylase